MLSRKGFLLLDFIFNTICVPHTFRKLFFSDEITIMIRHYVIYPTWRYATMWYARRNMRYPIISYLFLFNQSLFKQKRTNNCITVQLHHFWRKQAKFPFMCLAKKQHITVLQRRSNPQSSHNEFRHVNPTGNTKYLSILKTHLTCLKSKYLS